jgi:hypothetical protein
MSPCIPIPGGFACFPRSVTLKDDTGKEWEWEFPGTGGPACIKPDGSCYERVPRAAGIALEKYLKEQS